MKEQIKKTLLKTKEAIANVAEHENTKAAVDWSKKVGSELKDQATELGKEAMDSDMGKAAAKGAAVGAVAAIPIPLIGPVAGAVVGAGIGAFLNFKHGIGGGSQNPRHHSQTIVTTSKTSEEAIGNLEKLQQLRQTGAITETEFEEQKAKLLKRI